jgi:hypothetical protein
MFYSLTTFSFVLGSQKQKNKNGVLVIRKSISTNVNGIELSLTITYQNSPPFHFKDLWVKD